MKRTEFTQPWLAALRSGEYKQTHDVLTYNDRYCALGVGAVVSGVNLDSGFGDQSIGYVYEKIQNCLGMSSNERLAVVDMNDRLEKTFPEIADEIEGMLEHE